jgi:hypothetical protein
MRNQTPLRISCSECESGGTCEDCLVAFFTTDRDAEVVPFTGRAPTRRDRRPTDAALPDDLAAAFATLQSADLAPDLLSITPNNPSTTTSTPPTRIDRRRRSRAS